MSIQTLANSLGLSISTVSRALNGCTDESAATCAQVEAASKRMHYHSDRVAARR